MSVDVLIICTYVNEKMAAFRRVNFFVKYLTKRGFSTVCLGFPLLGINGVVKPSKQCLKIPVLLIDTKSTFIEVINIILSFFLIPYLIVMKPKVIVLSIPRYSPLIPVYLASRLLRMKLVIDVRDPVEEVHLLSSAFSNWFEKLLMKWVIRKFNYALYKRADAVITVTQTAKKMLEDVLKIKVVVAPNGADLETFKPIDRGEARRYLHLRDDDFVIVYVGGIGGYYRPLELLKIIKNLESKSIGKRVKLLLAGPIFNKTYERILLERRIPNVVYLGMLGIDELKILYSAADLGLIPRVDDPAFDYALPVKFYEYIAMGLPILALCRRESELARTIIKNGLGFVCEPSDETCIERAIEALLQNPKVYSELKEKVLNYKKLVDRRIGGAVLNAILKYLTKQ